MELGKVSTVKRKETKDGGDVPGTSSSGHSKDTYSIGLDTEETVNRRKIHRERKGDLTLEDLLPPIKNKFRCVKNRVQNPVCVINGM